MVEYFDICPLSVRSPCLLCPACHYWMYRDTLRTHHSHVGHSPCTFPHCAQTCLHTCGRCCQCLFNFGQRLFLSYADGSCACVPHMPLYPTAVATDSILVFLKRPEWLGISDIWKVCKH